MRTVFLHGALSYHSLGKIKKEIVGEQFRFTAPEPELKTEDPGPHLIVIAAHKVDGQQGDESRTKDRIEAALGLLLAFYGRNVAFEKLFECEVAADGSNTTFASEAQVNPLTFPKIYVVEDSLKRLQEASGAILRLSDAAKNRTFLSLKWFQEAIYDSNGLMGFLKYWIAIETLAMPDVTNVRPVNEILAQVYSSSTNDAEMKFYVGRIHGLRSDIVHDGMIVAIHSGIADYLQALYFDLLSFVAGLPSERRLETALKNPNFSVENFLKNYAASKKSKN